MSILNFVSTDATLSMPVATYEALLEKAVADEQARIIKLLEAHAETYLTTEEAIERELCEDWHTGITDAIALIKGESQKDNETVVLLTEGENK